MLIYELQKLNIVNGRKGGALSALRGTGRDRVRGSLEPTEGREGNGDQGS